MSKVVEVLYWDYVNIPLLIPSSARQPQNETFTAPRKLRPDHFPHLSAIG